MDPLWMAMPWLWLAPVVLSALFAGRSRWREIVVIVYACVAAVVGGTALDGYGSPREVTVGRALAFGLIGYAPISVGVTLVVELVTQFILRYVRVFADAVPGIEAPRPVQAPLQGGGEVPRGAGAPAASVVHSPARLWAFCVLVLLPTAVFPFAYRQGQLALMRQGGRRQAEEDWASGCPLLFPNEGDRLDDGRWYGTYDPATGLQIDFRYHDVLRRAVCEGYRDVIKDKLAGFGPAPMAKYLFRDDEFEALVRSGRVSRIRDFPLVYGAAQITGEGRVQTDGRLIDGYPAPAYMAVVPEKGNVLVTFAEDRIYVFHPDGRLLQVSCDDLARRLYCELQQLVPGAVDAATSIQ